MADGIKDEKGDGRAWDADHDLSEEELVAPEETIPWLPRPEPSDGDAPAP